MSLIKCPKCGHAVSDTSDVCQFCGHEVFPSQTTKAKASSKIYTEDELNPRVAKADAQKESSPQKKRKIGRIIAIIFIVLLAISALAYFFLVRSTDMTDESFSDTSIYEQEDVIEDDTNGDYIQDNGTTTDDGDAIYYDEDENGGTEDNGAVMSEDVTNDEVGD